MRADTTTFRIFQISVLVGLALGASFGSSATDSHVSDNSGQNLPLIDQWQTPLATLFEPLDVAIDGQGKVYVVDAAHNSVLSFDVNGALLEEWSGEWLATDNVWCREYPPVPLAIEYEAKSKALWTVWFCYASSDSETPPAVRMRAVARRLEDGTTDYQILAPAVWPPLDLSLTQPEPGPLFTSRGDLVWPTSQRFPLSSSAEMLRFAVTEADQVVVANGTAGLLVGDVRANGLRHVGPTGLDVVAVADVRDARAVIGLLGRSGEAGRLLTIDRDWSIVESRDVPPGVPAPPAVKWPWSVDKSGDIWAFSTSDSRFRLEIVSNQGHTTIRGARALNEHQVRLEMDRTFASNWFEVDTADGTTAILSGDDAQLVVLDRDGELVGRVQVEDGRDVAIGDGSVFVVTGSTLLRLNLNRDGLLYEGWRVHCSCDETSRLTYGGGVLLLGNGRRGGVGLIDPMTGASLDSIPAPGADPSWPEDVDSAGDMLVGVAPGDRVLELVRLSDKSLHYTVPVSGHDIPLKVAITSRGSGTLAVLTASGHVDIYGTTSPERRGRWTPVDERGQHVRLGDIAIDDTGVLLGTDASRRRVLRYDLPVHAPVTPTPKSSPSPPSPEARCTVSGDKVAAPGLVALGDSVQVQLTLAFDCPDKPLFVGMDWVIVLDRSGSMAGNKFDAARFAVRQLISHLSTDLNRAALVSFDETARTDVGLEANDRTILDAIDKMVADGKTDIGAGMHEAAQVLRTGRASALPFLILVSDGRRIRGMGADDLADQAADLRREGIEVAVLAVGDDADRKLLSKLPSSPSLYGDAAHVSTIATLAGRIEQILSDGVAADIRVRDTLGTEMMFVTGSAQPAASVSGRLLLWSRRLAPPDGITMTYTVQPQVPGRWPVNESAVAHFSDLDGSTREFEFPAPYVDVFVPSPTPTQMPSATREPTPTEPPDRLLLPLLLNRGCVARVTNLDVVLAIDTSSSMLQPAEPFSHKLDAAKEAVRTFSAALDLRTDRAAVVGFSETATVQTGLTGSRAALEAAVSGLGAGEGTRIDRALAASLEVFASAERDSTRALLLLSDGLTAPGSEQAALDAANQLRSAEVSIFTIALGDDIDEQFLRRVARDTSRYYQRWNATDLIQLYARLARDAMCHRVSSSSNLVQSASPAAAGTRASASRRRDDR